jgi:outer membrane protein TolC
VLTRYSLFIACFAWLEVSAQVDDEFRAMAVEPTTLNAVLRSSARHFPSVQAAQAAIAEREGNLLAAEGVFDPRVDGGLYSRLGGYYDGTAADVGFYQSVPFMGAEVFADYSVSGGDFPIYEDQLVTTDFGQARVGVALSLLRDREIDDRRFAVSKAELETRMAEFGLLAEQIDILQQAYIAYARWLISAQLLLAYEELLNIAVVRGAALERQVEAGDVAEILLVENEQAVLQREGLVVESRRQVRLSAERLALFLRDDQGVVVFPNYDESLVMPVQDEGFLDTPEEELIEQALLNRPDIAVAKTLQSQFRLEKRIAENLAKPRLDFRVYSARDFGSGTLRRQGTDTIADISFSIPLAIRTARGRAASADARLTGVGYELRLLIDEAKRDLRLSLVNLRATTELKEVALRELAVAQRLAEAELRQFEAGTSDYFLLNVRERSLGEAQLRRWQAELNHQVALANYYGVSMNREVLWGESPEPAEQQ